MGDILAGSPARPGQSGSNENTNGLLRQYLPRGTDFSCISQSYLIRRFTKLRHFRGRPRPELLYSARAMGCPAAFGAAMTRPATHQDTSSTKLDRSSTEFDSPSDCCDFGYDLVVVSGVQLKSNGVGKANPQPQFDPHRQFDPADH